MGSTSLNIAGGVAVIKIRFLVNSLLIGKGKAIPLHAWTGPEGSRRLRLPDFKTVGT